MQPPETRKPGELVFAVLLTLASLSLLYSAYGISGFDALSAPGAIPMATTLAMAISALIVLIKTARKPRQEGASLVRDVFPGRVVLMMALLLAYAVALKPLGFLPTSALFLILSIRLLGRRSWGFSVGVGLLSLMAIYLVFRILFTVLMPAGIVPEGEMLAWLRALFAGGR